MRYFPLQNEKIESERNAVISIVELFLSLNWGNSRKLNCELKQCEYAQNFFKVFWYFLVFFKFLFLLIYWERGGGIYYTIITRSRFMYTILYDLSLFISVFLLITVPLVNLYVCRAPRDTWPHFTTQFSTQHMFILQ